MQAPRGAGELGLFLGERLGSGLQVSLGKSRTQPVRATKEGGAWKLRLHRAFALAPDGVLVDLAAWLKAGRRARGACARLDAWIEEAISKTPAPPPRATSLRPRGECYDLTLFAKLILDEELRGEFGEELPCPALTWGRRGRSSSRRSLRLGSFDPSAHLIRMHPVLDQAGVPDWFVRFILFHELLHAVHPPTQDAAGRWIHHGREFRRRERAHVHFQLAEDWEQLHLPALIRSARTGSALPAPRSRDPRQGQLFG